MTTVAFRVEIDTTNAVSAIDPATTLEWLKETVTDGLGPAFLDDAPVTVEILDTRWHDDDCGTLCSGANCPGDHYCRTCEDDTP